MEIQFVKLILFILSAATARLSDNIYDYHYVSQGKVTVASIDDGEDMEFCHVRINLFYT